MTLNALPEWSAEQYAALEEGILIARHRINETGIFSEANLARIIDTHPAQDFSINTMGDDTTRFEWREGDRNGVPGAELLELMKRKRFWLNCRKMLRHHPEVRDLVDSIYDELETRVPGFRAEERSANLLISSPDALVHYHTDIPVNMLWHIQGRKRVWVYPPFDERFLPREVAELVCAGEWSEDIPFTAEMDRYAVVVDPQPGEVVTWPQMTPHRVENLEGLNVSLSTEHINPRATRRASVHRANYYLRSSFGMKPASCDVSGPVAWSKQKFARVWSWLKTGADRKKAWTYPVTFRVDPSAPEGYVLVEPGSPREIARHLSRDAA